MKEYFKRTKMMDEAKLQSKARRPLNEAVVFFLLHYIGSFAQGIFIYPAVFIFMIKSEDITAVLNDGSINIDKLSAVFEKIISGNFDWLMLVSLFSVYAIIIVVFIYCRFFEKRSIQSMGFRSNRVLSETGNGLIIGTIMFSLVIFIGAIIGAFKFNDFSDKKWWIIILYFFGYYMQGVAEEMLIHGYFMTSLSRSVTPLRALWLSSLMYVFVYSGSGDLSIISYVNLFLFSALLGIYVIKRGNIWGACAINFSWNFLRGVVFVVSSSESSSNVGLIRFTANEGLERVTGGIYGLENGLLVTLVLFAFIGIIFKSKQNSEELSDINIFEVDSKEEVNNDESV